MSDYTFSGGFQEIIASVRNMDRSMRMYKDMMQYEVIHEGQTDRSILEAWDLPAHSTADEVLLRHKNVESAWIRLVKFNHVPQVHVRDNSQSWDTGGIYDIDIRAVDYDKAVDDFQAAGFLGFSGSKRYNFGPFDVSEILMKGHEDIVMAVMKRYAPPLEGYPHLTHMSEPFNSSQIVKNYEASKSFFIDQLGWKLHSEYIMQGSEDDENLFGIPQNIYRKITRKIGILSPNGINYGSTELVQLEGLDGRDFSKMSVAPNLGFLFQRYEVSQLENYHSSVLDTSPSPIIQLNIPPYGNVNLFHVVTPDGVWIEFYEKA